MKNHNRCVSKAKLLALLLSALLLLGMLPSGAFAAQAGSLTVKLQQDTYANLPTDPAVEVTLYQIGVAAPETRAGWRIDSAFSGYKVLDAKTSSELADIAEQMAVDIVDSEYTGGDPKALSQGSAKFPDLQAGVYLGVLTDGPEGLEVDPFIVTVPSRDPETKEMRYDYDVTVKDKCVTQTTVRKVWNDNEDQDGMRPKSLKVALSNGTSRIKTVTLSAANEWEASVDNLPRYNKGERIAYSWTEEDLPEGYALSGTAVEGLVTTLTNVHAPETTSVTVRKVWDDADNQDGARPASLTVALSDGTLTVGTVALSDANNWQASIDDLPKYAAGEEIAYSWSEQNLPEGYVLRGTVTEGAITTLTNAYAPKTTGATVRKVWDDADDQDGIRPASLTVALLGDSKEIDTVVLSAANDWTATVANLPVYAGGKAIVYSWVERDLPEGYTLTGNTAEGEVTTLTNSHTPETTTATVSKVWDDKENQDGLRPTTLTVALFGDTTEVGTVTLNAANDWKATLDGLPKYAGGREIAYSWIEQDLPDGYVLTGTATEGEITTLTNSYTPETTAATVSKIWDDADNQDGIRPASLTVALSNGKDQVGTVTLDAANDWTATISDLPRFDGGNAISYSWIEQDLPEGYTLTNTDTKGTVTTLTNSHTPESVYATVRKVWSDGDNQDGVRPASLTVRLANEAGPVGTVTLNEANKWEGTIDGLPKYSDGIEIAYHWAEEDLPEGYSLYNYEATDAGAEGMITTLTNAYAPETTAATVRKAWNDDNNRDGLRPASLTVTLTNGAANVGTVTLNEQNNWTATIADLPRYEAGKALTYSWVEDDMPAGYALTGTDVEGTITTLTNTHTPEITSATVRKVWSDYDNQDNIRPASLRVALSDGTANVAAVTLSDANGWQDTIEDLPVYADGKRITYTWNETNLPAGYALTGNTTAGTVTTLTNTHTPERPVVEVSGQKIWDDESNVHGLRPGSITVQLYADGTLVNATPTWSNTNFNTWSYTFGSLPALTDSGATIRYSVRELPVDGYTTDISGTTITNKLIPRQPKDYKEISGVKTWVDGENAGATRPNFIIVHLLRDGVEIADRTVTAVTGWAYTFGMQPVDDGYGHIYQYEIREDGVPGYFCRIDGMNLINTTLSRTPDRPDNPTPNNPNSPYTPTGRRVVTRKTATPRPKYEKFTTQQLEELFDLFDYGTPLWGTLLGTGDETPIYPYIFGGVGIAAVIALLVFGRRRKKRAK